MTAKKKENPKEKQTARENVAPAEGFPNELQEQLWSVISFEKCEASGLTYAEAEAKIKEFETQNVSGLCIVTDEAAARIKGKNKT